MNKSKEEAFAMYNQVPFAFPHALEYIKYYTHKYNFPLIVTDLSNSKPAEQELRINGIMGTYYNRWCTRVYKVSPSKSFYKRYNLNGIEEVMGETKYQSSRRAKKDPNKHLSKKSTNTFKIYKSLPIFDMKEEEMYNLMEKHEIKINPTIKKFDIHGCMYCPMRNPKYYYNLKQEHPEMYKQCQQWRKEGSKRKGEKERTKEYYWFSKGKGSNLSKKMRETHPEYIEIM